MTLCRHCGKNTANRAGGLCRRCHSVPELRREYPARKRGLPVGYKRSTPRADYHEPTQEEVDQMVREQYRRLPGWWNEPGGPDS